MDNYNERPNGLLTDTPTNNLEIDIPKEKIFPSYYSILTAKVRYDKEIPMGAKVCFSEITALTNRSGYCYASNKYFAGLYGVSETTISTWIKKLQQSGHVTASYLNGQRKIYIAEQTIKAGAFPKQHPKAKTEKQEWRDNSDADKEKQRKAKQRDKDYLDSLGEIASPEEVVKILQDAKKKLTEPRAELRSLDR
tara:strand:+ start:312 stop:893 length:582 start_codon:yes stop_codon:yes gene_type:complete